MEGKGRVKFGKIAVAASQGAILAHALKTRGLNLKKGELIGLSQVNAMLAAGIDEIIAARLEQGDIEENEAARRLAEGLRGENLRIDHAFTGRCNLFAETDGLFLAAVDMIDRVNALDEAVTVATLPPMRRVSAGEMVATVKIIPFAVPAVTLARSLEAARAAPLRIAPFLPLQVGVVSTLLPGLKPATVTKTLRVLDERLAIAGAKIGQEMQVPHEAEPLAQALRMLEPSSDLLIVFGASAITDRRDIIPAAIAMAGGRIKHFGMPVDPGNLLLVGALPSAACTKPVIGAPGCARSPKENGFDFILQRFLAGVPVKTEDIRRMGAGGLLAEIVERPHPRESSDA